VPSLTRGRVCSLQLLLDLCIVVLLGSEFHTIFYCLKFETPATWRDRFLYLFFPGTRQDSPVVPPVIGTDLFHWFLSYSLSMDCTENASSNNFLSLCICCHRSMFTKLLPNSGILLWLSTVMLQYPGNTLLHYPTNKYIFYFELQICCFCCNTCEILS
jgi:hypothetical protein